MSEYNELRSFLGTESLTGSISFYIGKKLRPLHNTWPMLMTALKDPNGNHIEFTQLSERWIKHLEKRHAEGNEIFIRFDSAIFGPHPSRILDLRIRSCPPASNVVDTDAIIYGLKLIFGMSKDA